MTCRGCGDKKVVKASKGAIKIDSSFIRDAVNQKLISIPKGSIVTFDQSIKDILRPCCWQDIMFIAQASKITVEVK